MDRTRSLKGQVTKLFITSMKPFSRVSRDTVSNWKKFVLGKAGIHLTIFTPHSTRAASTSMALKAKVPLASILNTAGRSSQDTFRNFYNKPVRTDDQFASSLLLRTNTD